MDVRRFVVVTALLLGGGAGLGAAAAPELQLSGPDQVAIGRTAVFTMQAEGVTSEPVTLTLPTGMTYVSAEPGAVNTVDGGRNSGPCTADGQVVTCGVDHPEDELPSWTATVLIGDDVVAGSPLTLSAATGELTRTLTVVPVRGADLAVTVEDVPALVIPGRPLTYTAVVRNLGPDPATGFTLHEWFDGGWYRGGTAEHEGVQCYSDPGELACEVEGGLPAGGEIRLEHVLPTTANAATIGRRGIVSLEVDDQPATIDAANNEVSFPVRFGAAPPTSSPTPSSSPSPTASPTSTPAPTSGTATPAPGGGLPITGPGPGPLALIGAGLLLAGVATLRLGRRRTTR
ncbi:hypothetical protein OWR29_02845 [Actinoplanes sp. Pm04-4]|uniref:Uncharacterized protein n=1 Tax=Paractinoplanes pyxinae TaxID=2997416 RepID=A0ABT4ARN8_9ACTN|nr:hypothetical protein [Actinoplanes pyxinae]MCY1136919.1 hypothetical protein [Actinoplanes pyxinae]